MLSRRAAFTFGLSRLAAGFDALSGSAQTPAPARDAPPAPPAPPRAWPRGDPGLWTPIAARLPRPARQRVLDLDVHALDAASLPFEDATFDVVASAFGPMFSSDGRAAIDELFRVVRPGGAVAFTAWTPPGVVGRLLRLAAAHDPPPPGTPPPLAWGREERLRQELERHSANARLTRGALTCRFESCEEAVQRLTAALGPLAGAPRQPELHARVTAIIEPLAVEQTGRVTVEASYLLAEATRAPVLY